MPPALSDDENESQSGDEIPFRGKNAPEEDVVEIEDEDEEEEGQGGEGDEGEEEYVVEKIMSHAFDEEGVCMYEVKWLGYEKKSERTWEPEANLSGASELLQEYFDSIGGRPTGGDQKRKRARKSTALEGTPVSAKRVKKEKEWSPPPGSWENDVAEIDTVDERVNAKTGELERWAYVRWKGGYRTQHQLSMIYRKCPQKMLQYYESHLVFTHVPNKEEDEGLGTNGVKEVAMEEVHAESP